jgi:hypothetical protein
MDKENSTALKEPLANSHINSAYQTPKGQHKPKKQDQLLSAVEE